MPLSLRRLSDFPSQPISWLWPHRIPRGSLTIIEGDPGASKSTVLIDAAARITTGRPMPDTSEANAPQDVWFFSTEDGPETLRTRLAAHSGDSSRLLCADGASLPRLPASIRDFQLELAQNPPAIIVFDPLQDFLDSPMASERGVRSALRPLIALAAQHGVAIVGVRHLTKSGSNNLIHRGGGAVAVSAIARSVLLVAPDPRLPDRRILAQIKSSLGQRSPVIGFRLAPVGAGVIVDWLGRLSYTDSELAIGEHVANSPMLDEATYVLFSILAEGPVHSVEVLTSASQAGISRRTLERAKRRLRVASDRTGWGPGGQSFWRLPNDDELVELLRNRDLDELAAQLFHRDESLPPPPPPPIPTSAIYNPFNRGPRRRLERN